MSFKILSDTCSITRDGSHFVQVKTLKSPNHNDEVWVVFSMEGEHTTSRSMLENILNSIEDVYFDSTEGDAYERFENTLREINSIYQDLKKKKGGVAMKNISALITVFSGNQLYVTQSSEAEAYLIRNGKMSLVTEGLSGRTEDLFINIACGELLPEDKLLFSTSRLLRLITRAQLTDLCSEGVAESTDAIRELIMNESNFSVGIAFLHLKLSRGSDPKMIQGRRDYFAFMKPLWEKFMNFLQVQPSANRKPVNKAMILGFIVLFVLIFIFSIYYLGNRNRQRELRNQYRSQITAINDELNRANTEGLTDNKEAANAILDRVEEDVELILQSDYFQQEVLGLLKRAQDIRDSINETLRVTEIAPYVNLAENYPEISLQGMLNLKDHFFAYENGQIFEIVLDQLLKPKPLDANEKIVSSAPLKDQSLIVFLTESGKVMEYNEGEIKFANTTDETWKAAVDIASYGRNIYLLSAQDQQIYKYTRLRSDYNSSSAYSTDGDLSGALALAIDGSVYVLKEGGEIIKLFKGKQEAFKIENLPIDISTANDIFTDVELKNLYILDSSNQRVIIAQKELGAGARYKKEVYFEFLPEVKSIYVPEGEKEIYLLTEKAIYQVEI